MKFWGSYKLTGKTINMFDAVKDGVPQDREQTMPIETLTTSYLTLKVIGECETAFPIFKRN